MINLVLPFPPSMNTYWRNLKGRTLLSAKGRKYKNDVVYAVYDQLKKKPVPITGNVAVKIEFYPPNNIRRDMDNCFKALFDSLTTAGVWVDDSQIKRIESDWYDPIKNGKLLINIKLIEA
ncbi:RusA family crossover junction endodeoxyribonuclease [Gilliamella sp. wkB178]|uniref:RusA family crossover junction endodeoxyribonuclease n=1 Tax=Gilliamella sp. wkB178 TaxID=3120259 RepID=UPI001C3FF92F|nr:RusA family crossover junction endodeoxyribonuclease [Gilliamella apicola]